MRTGDTIHVDTTLLYEWFRGARPGDMLTYATGNIAMDRDDDDGTLHAVAQQVMMWEKRGYAHLFQRRVPLVRGTFVYEYRVMRRAVVDAAPGSREARFARQVHHIETSRPHGG